MEINYSLVGDVEAPLKSLLADYFDVMYFQDMQKFDRVFHPNSCLYSAQGGTELSIRPIAVYRDAMLARTSPAELGEERHERVLLVDYISPTLALVRVELQMFGGVMQDYLNLVHIDGQWWILAKMWERVGDAA